MKKIDILSRSTGQCEKIFRRTAGFILLCAALICCSRPIQAQLTTADILGTVTDATGAEVPNANITLLNLATHDQRSTVSNASGDYQFTLLPVGQYSITVKVPGFKTSTTNNLAVEAGDRARADVHMETGGVSETVNVEASTPLLQADNATVSSTVTAKAVQDLPLNGRNFVQLVQLVPGANEGPGNGLTSGGRPDDRRASSSFSVNGQDDTLNNTTIDGIDDNERLIGTIAVKPSVEGIQEITVQTNSYAAEAGRTAGGVVSIITRSGSNQFHGTAYEFLRNDIFDARNVLQTTGRKPELRQNQFGGSIGGPIFKDRTFFFGDYEGFRQVTGVTYTSTVPTVDEYNDINSIGGGSPQALVAAGNGTAAYRIDPVALNYLKLFPAPNTGAVGQLANNYVVSPNRTQYSNIFDVRVDHKFNERNNLFARVDYNKVETVTPQALGTAPNGIQVSGGRYIFAGPNTSTAQQYALGYTHIFTQNLLIDLRLGFTRVNNLSLPLNYGTNPDTTVGFGSNMNFNTLSSFLTPVSIGPFADVGDGAYIPLQDIDNTFQYSAAVSYSKGNHNMKFGVTFLRRQARNLQSNFAAGQYGFNLATDNCVAGTSYNATANSCLTAATAKQRQDNQIASTLVGAFTSDSRSYDLNPPDYRSYEPSGFAQDNWKVNPKLTLSYGIRYDVFTPFTEAHSYLANFDYNQALASTAANVSSALKIANVNGVDGHAGINTDYSNVAPRVGFSVSVTPTTVLRGGYGLSFFPTNYTSNASLKNVPFVSVFSPNCQAANSIAIQLARGDTLSNIGGNGACGGANAPTAPATFDAGLPLPATPNVSNLASVQSLSFIATSPKLRSALIQQFNMQVERQFGANVLTIGYVGNIGQHLPQVFNDVNMPKPFSTVATAPNYGTGARPLAGLLPNLSSVGIVASEGYSNYNALQTSFQRRFTKGLAFDANYTWGKAMSNITGYSEEGQQGWGDADWTRVASLEYGVAENNIKNRFALSLNYEFQFGKSFTGIKRQALSGWQVNTITVWQSGKPFTIVNGGSEVGFSTNNHAVPFNNPGADRPNQIGNPNLGHKTNAQFFNTAAFQGQPLGTVGTTPRNSLTGPDFRHVDLSLFKDFPITERLKVQFRAEAFNISNTPNFYIQNNTGNGNTQVGSITFGQVNQFDPNYNPRLYQFAFKAQF